MYQFGPFRADTIRGVLTRNGEPVQLTGKCFDILLHLLRNGPETVSKDDLMKAVWANTFVEESNLTQHISLLRKALGESPQDRLYIATVPGHGYRFVAQITTSDENLDGLVLDHSSNIDPVAEAAPAITPAESKTTRIRWLIFPAMAAVLVAGAVYLWFQHRERPHALGAKDSILLADFDNQTGEPVFDGALTEGMAVGLEQSPFIDLVTPESVRETLQFMGHSTNEPVHLPLAREICQRLGAQALISGSVTRIGDSYVVALQAERCADRSVLARDQIEVRTKEEVLPGLGKLSSQLRRTLGESLGSIQQFDSPIVQATTPSLEALKAYSVGMATRTRGSENDAVPFFEHAVELDPNFAMAYAQLGTAYSNLGESERAAEYIKRAYGLREKLSEQEKLYLTAKYHTIVTGDITKATETYEVWSQLYPKDWSPFNGLAARYLVMGRYEEAKTAAEKTLTLQPYNYSAYANLAAAHLSLNHLDQAEWVCNRAQAVGRDSIYTHQVLFEIAFVRHNEAEKQRQVDWSKNTKRESDMLTTRAFALTASGELQAAQPLFEESWAASERSGLPDHAAYSMANEALAEADLGNFAKARSRAAAALRLGQGIDVEEMAAEALALSGDERQAQALVTQLHKSFPAHGPLNGASLPATLAALALRHNDYAKAIRLLGVTGPYDLSEFADLSPIYIRGQAYLSARSGKAAAAQFQKILDYPGIDATSQRHALAYLGLGRADLLIGDLKKSRESYDHFFALWSKADTNIPVLLQAKREYQTVTRALDPPLARLAYGVEGGK